MSSSFGIQVTQVARRSMRRMLRRPAQWAPGFIFPLFLLAVNTGGLAQATRIPGFPTHSYLTFALAVPFMQSALFATLGAGTDLAEDIRTGFLDRLSLTPLRRPAILAGQLAGAIAIGIAQALVYIAVGLIAGADIAAGPGGVAVLLLLSISIALAFGAIGLLMALRTGSGEAVQGLFPLLFVLLFLSSMSLPRNLIAHGWFKTIATYNPVSYLIEGIRSLLITGWDSTALLRGFGVAAVTFTVFLALSARALETRMART